MKTNIKLGMIAGWLLGLFLFSGSVSLLMAEPLQPHSGSIGGLVTYTGVITGTHEIIVAAHPVIDDPPVASAHVFSGDTYALSSLQDGTYYISAFLDANDSGGGPPDPGEPTAYYDGNGDGNPDPVVVSGNVISNIDIALTDGGSATTAVSGLVSYVGLAVTETHKIFVSAHTTLGDTPLFSVDVMGPSSAYTMPVSAGTYYIVAFLDSNDSDGGPPDPGEPTTVYDGNGDGIPDPVTVSDTIQTGINLTLYDDILHVDTAATGANTGESWENAYTDLTAALAAAVSGQEIWVAAGSYLPGDTRESTFTLKDGVAVYGGFAGDETVRRERDYAHNHTILSGDVGVPGTATDNVYHVVTSINTDETAVLDGFIITGGYANGNPENDKGGGIYNQQGSPTLANLRVIGNYATNHGGGIVNQFPGAGELLIINSQFSGNSTQWNGGAIANINGASSTIVNSSIVGNSGSNGGGIVNLSTNSHANVHNTILWGNGRQIGLQSSATISVTYSIVEGGYVGVGNLSSDPLLVDADGADNTFGTLDDDLHIQAGSPAIDAGDNTSLPSDSVDTDGDGDIAEPFPLDGDVQTRQIDDAATADTGNGTSPLVDIGADEYLALVIPTGQTLVLDGGLTTGGLLDIQGGVLNGNGTIMGDVRNGGVITPGFSPGTIGVQGNYTQTLSGTLKIEMELDGVPALDQFTVDGHAILSGTLEVVITDGYEPAIGETFKVMTYTTHSGTFSTLNLPDLPNKDWMMAYEADGVYMTVLDVAPPTYIYLPVVLKP